MYRRHILKVSVLLTPFVAMPFAAQSAYAAECGAAPEEIQSAVLDELNRIRSSATQCGSNALPPAQPLTWNDTLAGVAGAHADDMATNNFESFVGSDGLFYTDKVRQAGYPFNSLGGSITTGQPDVAEFLQASLGTSGTCQDLVSSDFEEVGASCTVAPEGNDADTYWTLFLGSQFDAPVPGEPTTVGGQVSLASLLNNLCIDVPSSNFTAGTQLNMYRCNDSAAQRWSFSEGRLQSANDMCMSTAGGGTANGLAVELASCSDDPAQRFTLTENGDLLNDQSGRCVEISNSSSLSGAPLVLFNCQGTTNQKWAVNG